MPEKDHGPIFTAVWIVVEEKSWELVPQKRGLEGINGIEKVSSVFLKEIEHFFNLKYIFAQTRCQLD